MTVPKILTLIAPCVIAPCVIALSVLALAGCKDPAPAAAPTPAEKAKPAAAAKAAQAAAGTMASLEDLLTRADKADGKADKLIEGCPACGLKMKGDAKNAGTLHGHTFHACSADCRKATLDDPKSVFSKVDFDGLK